MKRLLILKLFLTLSLVPLLGGPACKGDGLPKDSSLTGYSEPQQGILPFFKGRVMDPYWPEKGEKPADLRGLLKFRLTSHLDKTFTPAQLKGNYALVNFFYATCHGICPKVTRNMQDLSNDIKDHKNLMFLSITVHPENDTPAVMTAMRKRHKLNRENWLFLTGDRPQIEKIAREQFAGDVKTRKGLGNLVDFVHTENAFLLDRDGFLRGIYRARGKGDFPRLMRDLATLRESERKL